MKQRTHLWLALSFSLALAALALFPTLIRRSAAMAPADLIGAVRAQSANPYAVDSLAQNSAVYTDRRFVFTSIPAELNGQPMIRTPNDDKASTGDSFLSFQLSQGAVVYVAYDSRATARPAWLATWEDAGATLGTSDVARRLYRRAFPAGPVTLGGNMAAPAAGALSHYSVIVVPGGAPPAPEPTAAPQPSATPPPPPAPGAIAGAQWAVTEINLLAQSSYTRRDAYTSVEVTAVFSSGSRSLRVRGFWDGDRTWRVRFTPPTAGQWSYTISNNRNDPGLRAQGVIDAAPAPAGSRGFLRVEASLKRTFRFDSGERYFMLGTTAYEVVNQYRAGADLWRTNLAQSAAHGINKVRFRLYPSFGSSSPQNYDDTSLYLENNRDLLDIAHWRALDEIIAEIGRNGMIADLIVLQAKPEQLGSAAQEQRLTRYILARYAATPHVIWTLANEYEEAGLSESYWNSIGQIIAAEDPWASEGAARRPLSIHQSSRTTFSFAGQSWPAHVIIQYNHRAGLPYGDQWGAASIKPSYGQGRPVVNDEPGYYTQTQNGVTVSRDNHRRAHWAIVVSGGYGTTGDARLFNGGQPYRSADWNDPQAAYDDLKRLKEFFTRRVPRWWELTPQRIVSSGSRVYVTGKAEVAYVVYAAAGGRFTLSLPAQDYTALRYDPRTGDTASLGVVRGSSSFTMPNSADWVVLLVKKA